jgi:D-tyrosyl-tRNA(Tyr) deacylase
MRIILQRVSHASVVVDQKTIASINEGLLLLTGFGECDRGEIDQKIVAACNKIIHLRVFSNSAGKLDHSLVDISGEILLVPQFTLYGKSLKGRRPDFTDALSPDVAEPAFNQFRQLLSDSLERPVAAGQFGTDMQVSLVNDGPLTLQFDF